MTGIQALERIAPGLPMKPGKVERCEFEYRRHGTQTLIAGFDVTIGKVTGVIGDTRTEQDFARFLDTLLSSAAATHGGISFAITSTSISPSPSFALLPALRPRRRPRHQRQVRRARFKGNPRSISAPERPSHRLPLHPKHASWLNQIEIWFSILARKLIRRGNFASKDVLKTKIEQFIAYFNATMASLSAGPTLENLSPG